jgi:hypothetical protein
MLVRWVTAILRLVIALLRDENGAYLPLDGWRETLLAAAYAMLYSIPIFRRLWHRHRKRSAKRVSGDRRTRG